MNTVCRLLIDSPGEGCWNMAVDQALLESAVSENVCTLRLYRWAEPTLSLGYFQTFSDREKHASSQSCPVVRRASGGGAILHDRELTYSLALPPKHRWTAGRLELYQKAHQAIVEILAETGVGAVLFDGNSKKPDTETPFLCFQRRAVGDLLIGEDKVGGSAQRRFQGAVLQHGSLLLRRSDRAPELPGILDLAPDCKTAEDRFEERLLRQWENDLGLVFEPSRLSGEQLERATRLTRQKYGNRRWTENRDKTL